MNDLTHDVHMFEHSLSGLTSEALAKSKEHWFISRLNEEEIISAIEQLQVVLVLKRAQKNMERAA